MSPLFLPPIRIPRALPRFLPLFHLLLILLVAISTVSIACAQSSFVFSPLPSKLASPDEPRLLVLVPGGKVDPPACFPILHAIQERSTVPLFVGVIICHANLCDPLEPAPFGVDALVQSLIHNATALGFNHSTDPSHIFITGHSLGAIGARHFVDHNKGYAGLGIFGTQFTGDHEDFLGNLGPIQAPGFPWWTPIWRRICHIFSST